MISSSKYFRISKKFNTQTKQKKKTDNEIERQIERTKISHNNLSLSWIRKSWTLNFRETVNDCSTETVIAKCTSYSHCGMGNVTDAILIRMCLYLNIFWTIKIENHKNMKLCYFWLFHTRFSFILFQHMVLYIFFSIRFILFLFVFYYYMLCVFFFFF